MRRIIASAIVVLSMAAAPLAAAAQAIPATTTDALCRKDLHKTLSRLTRTSMQGMSRCHKERMKGDLPVVTDCNSEANVPNGAAITREQSKVRRRADVSCTGGRRPAVSAPSVLGYDSCPAPCGAVPIGDTYDGVVDCLLCLNTSHTESLTTSLYGTPPVPLDRDARRCQERVGAAAWRYLTTRMKLQHACQSNVERGHLPADTDCVTADPNGRHARARASLQRAVLRCSDATVLGLATCADTAAAADTCVANGVEDVAAQLFRAVFRPVSEPATATPTTASTETPIAAATATATTAPDATATATTAPPATATHTSAPAATATSTVAPPTPTETPAATATPTEPPATDTPVATATATEPPAATATATEVLPPTATPTEPPALTSTPTATFTATATPVSCDDGIQNGDETDVDCGGASCAPCDIDEGCLEAADCDSGHCVLDGGFCGCPDQVFNIEYDPLGSFVGPCDDPDAQWDGGNVSRTSAANPACSVAVRRPQGHIAGNGETTEWRVNSFAGFGDCSISACRVTSCSVGGGCGLAGTPDNFPVCDCGNGDARARTNVDVSCTAQEPSCSDGHHSPGFGETDVDCGGPCAPCANGLACSLDGDCNSGVCFDGVCQACDDGVQNGTETDVDCGGVCGGCGTGDTCTVADDCVSGNCVDGGFCGCPAATVHFTHVRDPGGRCSRTWGPGDLSTQEPLAGCSVTLREPTGPISATPDGSETPWQVDGFVGFSGCALDNCSVPRCNGNESADGSCTDNYPQCTFCNTNDQSSRTEIDANCQAQVPTCSDGFRNPVFGETDVDCGGPCGATCTSGQTCSSGADCASGTCSGGQCS